MFTRFQKISCSNLTFTYDQWWVLWEDSSLSSSLVIHDVEVRRDEESLSGPCRDFNSSIEIAQLSRDISSLLVHIFAVNEMPSWLYKLVSLVTAGACINLNNIIPRSICVETKWFHSDILFRRQVKHNSRSTVITSSTVSAQNKPRAVLRTRCRCLWSLTCAIVVTRGCRFSGWLVGRSDRLFGWLIGRLYGWWWGDGSLCRVRRWLCCRRRCYWSDSIITDIKNEM